MKWLLRWLWRPKTTTLPEDTPKSICCRVGESRLIPTGSVVAQCHSCGEQITIDPRTVELKRQKPDLEFHCIQCVARDEPNLVINHRVVFEGGGPKVVPWTVLDQLNYQIEQGISPP